MLAAVEPYAAPLCRSRDWPELSVLQDLIARRGIRNQRGTPLQLVAPSSYAESYEERIYLCGELQVRLHEWHDLFNVLAWLMYPQAKAALNARHVAALACERTSESHAPRNRGSVRDALTLFDESGAIIVSDNAELLHDVRAFRWKELFWDK